MLRSGVPKTCQFAHRAHRHVPRVPFASRGGSCCRGASAKASGNDSDVIPHSPDGVAILSAFDVIVIGNLPRPPAVPSDFNVFEQPSPEDTRVKPLRAGSSYLMRRALLS
jgi:hypothetical protein